MLDEKKEKKKNGKPLDTALLHRIAQITREPKNF